MYNNIYQEYINNMLGTIPREQPSFEFDSYRNSNFFQNTSNNELERFYPDLYRLLYPMIQSACMRNTKPITEETINEMVNDIYSNFNVDDINELANDVRSTSKSVDQAKVSSNKTSESSKTSSSKTVSKVFSETRNQPEAEERNRRPNNFVLNDLIRILLIRELLGRPGNFLPNRPGFPPPGPGGRPPFRPREMSFASNEDVGIYEEPHMYYNFNQ